MAQLWYYKAIHIVKCNNSHSNTAEPAQEFGRNPKVGPAVFDAASIALLKRRPKLWPCLTSFRENPQAMDQRTLFENRIKGLFV